MMKTIAIAVFLLLVSLSFAAGLGWVETSAFAIVISAIFLALLFAIGHGLNIQELEMSSKEELYQLIVAIVLLGSFFALTAGMDTMVKSFGGAGLHDSVNKSLDADIKAFAANLTAVQGMEQVSIEGTRSLVCQFFTASLTYSSCGGFSALSPPLSTVNTILATVIVEYNTLKLLLDLGSGAAIAVLLPMGILFRSFKLTRAFGGVLLAIAFTFYLVLPLMIYFANGLYADYEQKNPQIVSMPVDTSIATCDPSDDISTNDAVTLKIFDNMLLFLEVPMRLVLIKGLLFPLLYLTTVAASVRAVGAVAGAEIDITALGRLM